MFSIFSSLYEARGKFLDGCVYIQCTELVMIFAIALNTRQRNEYAEGTGKKTVVYHQTGFTKIPST